MNIQRNHLAKWCGIVMVIRQDPSKLPHGVKPQCQAVSKRDPELGDRRAISTPVDYDTVRKFFKAGAGDAVEVYVELLETDAVNHVHHLEFIELASKRDFFLHVPQVTPSPVPAH